MNEHDVIEAEVIEIETGSLFGERVQVVDVPATGHEVTEIAIRGTQRRGLPTTWQGIDPREPVTAAIAPQVMALYEDWLGRNIRSRGRKPAQGTIMAYLHTAEMFLEWLCAQTLPPLPDWYDGPAGGWQLWTQLDQVFPRPGIPLVLLTAEVIEMYIQQLIETKSAKARSESGEYAPATLQKETAALKKFFRFCRKQRWLMENPLEDAEIMNQLPRDNRSKVQKLKTLFPEEAESLVNECTRAIQAASGHPDRQARAIRNYAVIALMMGQGLRTIEIFRLNLSSYDETRGQYGTLTVLGKGDKERSVPLRPVPATVLKLWLKFRALYRPGSEAVFINLRPGTGGVAGEMGARLSRRRIRQIVDAALEKCGLKREGVSCHALRHTYATGIVWMAREKGLAVDMNGIAQTMGHSDTKTTEVYVDVVDLYQNNPAQLLDGWFSVPEVE